MTVGAVLVVGTADTKAAELAYVAGVVRDRGVYALVVDVGTTPHDAPVATVEVGPDEVAAHHPGGADAVRSDDRGEAVGAMAVALEAYVRSRSDIAGIIGIGGSGGTALITPAMRALPIGIPKVMVSTVASGYVANYVGVADIAGLELRKLGFPEAQHVLLDAELHRHLADVAKRLHRLCQGQPPLLGASVPIRLFCRSAPDQTRVDAILHDVAGPEHQHATRRDRNFLARLWIASHPLALLADAERAERGQLDRLAGRQAGRNLLQYQLHQLLRLVAGQSDFLDYRLRKICTRERLATHGLPPLPAPYGSANANCGPFRGVNNNQLKLHT